MIFRYMKNHTKNSAPKNHTKWKVSVGHDFRSIASMVASAIAATKKSPVTIIIMMLSIFRPRLRLVNVTLPLLALLLFALPSLGQNIRYDFQVTTTTGVGQLLPVLAIPGSQISFYSGCTTLPCVTKAVTYVSVSSGTACPSNAQVVWQLPIAQGCVSTADSQGNFGGYFQAGQYQYTETVSGHVYGPYEFEVGAGAGSSTLVATYPWVDPRASQFGASCSNNPAVDDSTAITNALAFAQTVGEEVQIAGTCWIQHPIIWPVTAASPDLGFGMRGAATGGTIKAAPGFPDTGTETGAMIFRAYGIGSAQQVTLHDITLDANAGTASACMTFESQRLLYLDKVHCLDATGNGGGEMNFGRTAGGSALVGLTARDIDIDNGGIVADKGAAARPNYGIYMNLNASDGDVSNVVVNQNKIAGVYINSGNNKFASLHPFGFTALQVPTATWPNFGIFLDTHAFGNQFSNTQCDTVQLACFHTETGFMNATNTVLECNDGGTGSLCQPFIVEAGASAIGSIFLYGGIYQAGSLTAPQSPINWLGTPDVTTSTYLTQWGINQVAGRNGLHLGTGSATTTVDNQITSGFARFNGTTSLIPSTTATSGGNVLPPVLNNTASIWNGSAAVGSTWSLNRFTSASGIPTFDQLVWANPSAATSATGLAGAFAIADLSSATALANFPPPDFLQEGACWDGATSHAEGFFWRLSFGTGANPTESLNMFSQNHCSGVKTVSALFPWTIASLTTAFIKTGVSTNTDMAGELALAGTTSSYSFLNTYTSHPECTVTPQFNPTTNTYWITYSGSTSFTVNFSGTVTGSVSYTCTGRN